MNQCADQYGIALSPRSAIFGLSPRVFANDFYLRTQARGLSVRRADRESTLAVAPNVVVPYWGGDPGLNGNGNDGARGLPKLRTPMISMESGAIFASLRPLWVRLQRDSA